MLYSDRVEEMLLSITPSHKKGGWVSRTISESGEVVDFRVYGEKSPKKITVVLPQRVVQLKIPPWVGMYVPRDYASDVGNAGVGPDSTWMFQDEAEKLWAEFIAQKPF